MRVRPVDYSRFGETLNRIRCPVPNAEPYYDAMSDGLVWSDETALIEKLKLDSDFEWHLISALRPVWHHRARLICGESSDYQPQWIQAKCTFPDWIGFLPERTGPDDDLAALFVAKSRVFARQMERCPEALERLMRWRKIAKQREEDWNSK